MSSLGLSTVRRWLSRADPELLWALAIGGTSTALCYAWIQRLVILTNIAGVLGIDYKPGQDDDDQGASSKGTSAGAGAAARKP